ncbi:MAG: response regulator [Spirochaetales bacterium]|nr:response regulator [Spirochaetales bacterium]
MSIQTECTNRILIVDDEEILRNLIVRFMKKEGYEPIEASEGKAAIELYKITHPQVVLSDVRMPGMDGITLLRRVKKIDPQAIFILMTGYGDEETVLEALRAGATNFFKKPFNFKEVSDVISSVIRHKMMVDISPFYSGALVEETKKFEIETADANILPIINQIGIHLKGLFPESDIINLKIGIEEMITNAIEHGNLCISFEEKSKALTKGILGKLIRERMKEKDKGDKKVYVHSEFSQEGLKIKIIDEGKGFNWRTLPDPDDDDFLNYHGRGIFLTRIFYDEVIFNEQGNEVTIIKRKSLEPAKKE